MYLFIPFIMQNNIKFFKRRSRILRTRHLRAKNNPFTLNKILFPKTTNINFICLLAPFFHCAKLKKIFKHNHSYEDVPISTQIGSFAPNKTFTRKIIKMINTHINFGSKTTHLRLSHIFWKNHSFKFHVPFGPIYCAKLKNGSRVDPKF